MKIFRVFRVFRASSSHIEQLEAIIEAKPKLPKSSSDDPLFVDFELEERRTIDLELLEEYCRNNHLRFWKLRRRTYSKTEVEATKYFLMRDEDSGVDTSGTQYTVETCCRLCGVGLTQRGPLIIDLKSIPKKRRLFCVSLRHSEEWVLTTEASGLFQKLSGFRLGDVCDLKEPEKPLDHLRQVIIEQHLPRMASTTNFTEYDPPMEKKCACNRAGWNLRDEVIYESAALEKAKDFNLTVERWYGGGMAGLNWPIVSHRVRRLILENRLLSRGSFDPVHIIEHDPGGKYKFQLALDAPVSSSEGA
jgi:hypothetical protein